MYYVGIIINFNLLRRYLKDKKYIKFNTQYFDCLYKYSHKKLSNLFADKILKFLFEDLFETGKIYELMREDETMNKNFTLYEDTINVFKNSFKSGKYMSNTPASKFPYIGRAKR